MRGKAITINMDFNNPLYLNIRTNYMKNLFIFNFHFRKLDVIPEFVFFPQDCKGNILYKSTKRSLFFNLSSEINP